MRSLRICDWIGVSMVLGRFRSGRGRCGWNLVVLGAQRAVRWLYKALGVAARRDLRYPARIFWGRLMDCIARYDVQMIRNC